MADDRKGIRKPIRKRKPDKEIPRLDDEIIQDEENQEQKRGRDRRLSFQYTWLPAIGWLYVLSAAWNYLLAPAIMAIAELAGHPIHMKLVQDDILMKLLSTALGMCRI